MKELSTHEKALCLKILISSLVIGGLSILLLCLFPSIALRVFIICELSTMVVVLMIIHGYLLEEDARINDATEEISRYLLGDVDARIQCNEEGALYRLFHEVNTLGTILNAKADNEQREKEFLKNTISDISHQLKTPLAALNIYNGILQEEGGESPTIREFTDLSEQELDRIEILVQNLLKITKFDSGTMILEMKDEKVSDMMDNIENHFMYRAKVEDKQLHFLGDEATQLRCDANWLMEAISNLVKNALDHTHGGDAIWVKWHQSPTLVQILVEDNGEGIHEEDVYHIFKRFYRSRFSVDTVGIGLGLPLAKAIVEAHHGTIEVDSERGRGTVFTVNIMSDLQQ